MKTQNHNTQDLLDQAVEGVRTATASADAEREAAARVWERLKKEAAQAQDEPKMATVQSIHRGDASEDAADWLSGDRARIAELRRREASNAPKAASFDKSRRWSRLAMAAGVLLAVAVAALLGMAGLFGGPKAMAEVASVDGQLFRIDGNFAIPAATGESIAEGEEIRTSKGGGAVIRLNDGSLVELRERSEVSLADAFGETTIRVDRGSVIVEAAEQRQKNLYVSTDDCLVAVTGTIFSVNHGTKGSRVSVIEGEVRVEQGRDKHLLHPGMQVSTRPGLAAVPVAQEVAWSRDGDRYAQLLDELKTLQQELDRALGNSGLRYESELLDLVPAGTVIYAGVPNVTAEIAEFERVVEERLAQSPMLRAWWDSQVGANGIDDQVEQVLARIQGLGEHLGDEITIALALDDAQELERPLILAEVADPAAFAAVLASEIDRINGQNPNARLRLIDDPATATPGDGEELLLWPAGSVFAAATTLDALQELAALLPDPAANPFRGSAFYGRLNAAYAQGAQYLMGVDVATVIDLEGGGDPQGEQALAFSGFDQVQHLIVERKKQDSRVHTGAALSFDGPRTGVASWLAEPAPIGGLDFVSPDADLAFALAVEEPAEILSQVFEFIRSMDPNAAGELDGEIGPDELRMIEDLAAALGGEVTLALDGPALPSPAWKVVAEVYNHQQLQATLEEIVQRISDELVANGGNPVEIVSETVNGRTYYTMPMAGSLIQAHYTYDSGYWLAAPSRALLDRAIQVREAGFALPDSTRFVELLPQDGFVNFSAVMFTDLSELGDQLVSLFGMRANLSGDEQAALRQQVDGITVPTLTCAYGETDQIRLVSTSQGGLLGSRLGSLLGMGMLANADAIQ